jgi:hypothetical protein
MLFEYLAVGTDAFEAPLWVVAVSRVAWVVIHVAFASAVYADIRKLQAGAMRIRLIHPFLWVLATVLGGVLTVGVYWIVHNLPSNDRTRVGDPTSGSSQ